jgi:hypothetical protein
MSSTNSRTCSFCRQAGHNIKTCNDIRIQNFETRCAQEVQNYNYSYYDFQQWLRENYTRDTDNILLLKVFTKQKFHVIGNIYLDICIEYISLYIFSKYNISGVNQNEENIQYNEGNYRVPEILNDYYENLRILVRDELRNNNIEKYKLIKKCSVSVFVENKENEYMTINRECNICYDEKINNKFVKLNCSHEFCGDCIVKILKTPKITPCCAFCRDEIKTLTFKSDEMVDVFL